MATKTVTVGGKEHEIQRFKGLKAILAIAAVTRIAREVPDIMADVAKDYNRRHTAVVTETMAKLPRWSGFSKEDFDAAEARTGKRELEIPEPIGANEQLLQALPRLLEEARKEVVRLLAILIVPNSALKEADKEDRVEALLDEHYDLLMYDADLEELAELGLAAQDVLKEQLDDKKDRLGKLLGGLWSRWRPAPQSTIQTPDSETKTMEELEAELVELTEGETSPTSTGDAPTSSTPSPPTTDGAERPSSLTSPGVS